MSGIQQTLEDAIVVRANEREPLAKELQTRGIRRTPAMPFVFEYNSLWQHRRPMLDMLRDYAGNIPLDQLGGVYGWSVRYRQREDYEGLGIETLGDYIDAFRAGEKRLPYLRHISLNRTAAGLRKYIKDPLAFSPNWVSHRWLDRLGGPELFIGQQGTSFGHVHRDHVSVHVGFVQLQGEKEMVLFPPEDRPYLYEAPGREFPFQNRATRIHYKDLNNFEKFPLLANARPHRILLRAGQALLMPANWWHTTYNPCDSMSYSIRIINSTNVLNSMRDHIRGIPRWVRRKLQADAA